MWFFQLDFNSKKFLNNFVKRLFPKLFDSFTGLNNTLTEVL